jgi:hypothetical protein
MMPGPADFVVDRPGWRSFHVANNLGAFAAIPAEHLASA